MRETVISTVEKEKIIAILRGIAGEDLIPLAEALYAGGIRLLEITYDASGRVSDGETAASISALATHFAGRMLIGAGTVLTEEQVALTQAAGGKFIISPDTCEKVIQKTRALGMVSIPGALTPTEIAAAHRAGADFVKLFPVNALGAAYVKAIRAPLSHVRLLAVGGIRPDNMGEYLQAGIAGFGIGSNITPKDAIKAKDFERITALARQYAEEIAQ